MDDLGDWNFVNCDGRVRMHMCLLHGACHVGILFLGLARKNLWLDVDIGKTGIY